MRYAFLKYLAVFLLGAAAFWGLRPFHLEGGDTGELARWIGGPKVIYYYRAPATHGAHQLAYAALGRFGWSRREVMGLNSALAGGVFLAALLAVSRHPLFWLVNLSTSAMLLFAGHEENYGYVNALLLVFIACAQRLWRAPEGSPEARRWAWAAGGVFALGCLAHMLTVFYAPALLALAFRLRREDGRWRVARPLIGERLVPYLVWIIVLTIVISVAPLAMSVIGRVTGKDNNLVRFAPLFATDNPRYFFTMFSWGHARFLAFLYLMSAPAAPFLILALFRRHGRDPFGQWLLLCCLCGAAWTFLWHPDLNRRDWDLFSNVAFTLNCLAGLLLARAAPKGRFRRKRPTLPREGFRGAD